MSTNKVIAGKYNGCVVTHEQGHHIIIEKYKYSKETLTILIPEFISHYEVITEETYKSGTSAILRGAVGAALLGGVGILAGLTAKNKGIYTIAIEWEDGEKSLIEIDEKLYKKFITDMF